MTDIKNIIFHTQSNGYTVFENIIPFLENLEKIGFFVTDKEKTLGFYKAYQSQYNIISEWEILKEVKASDFCSNRLDKYEEIYGEPFLWNTLLNDRRIRYKLKSQFIQSYKK